jgi:group I intron endonuclease
MNRKGVIYKLTFPNNKIYIGQSINYSARMLKHKSDAYKEAGKNYNIYLYKAIRKYGWDNVSKEILEEVDVSRLDDLELYYQEKFHSFEKEAGYNLVRGGQVFRELSDSARNKIRERMLGNKFALGSKSRLGQKATSEMKLRMSAAQKGNKNGIGNKSRSGKKHSEDTKRKMSEAQKIKVGKYDLNDNLIIIYDSAIDAQLQDGFSAPSISRCALGNRKTYAGYKWKYVEKARRKPKRK